MVKKQQWCLEDALVLRLGEAFFRTISILFSKAAKMVREAAIAVAVKDVRMARRL